MEDSDPLQNIKKDLAFVYGEQADAIFEKLIQKLETYKDHQVILEKRAKYEDKDVLSQEDVFLITYANSIIHPGEKPLQTLQHFLSRYIGDTFTGIHLLPFYPSSSDGGFSVIDFKSVDPALGDWEDIETLGKDYRIMADLVLNHVSVKSEWFQQFLAGNPEYQDYFLSYDQAIETHEVFRPRVHPLLTPFTTANGEKKYVWTTFSEDQVDLNFSNPQVLLEIIEVMCFYLSKGIEGIRLDAVAYLWKDPQTSSIHDPKTHALVRILRSVIESIAPYSFLISETNVPYNDNISYMGNGQDEVHMVYGFDVPPLVAHAFIHEDASRIKQFCSTAGCEEDVLFFHFLASHDGIGLLGAENILTEKEVGELTQTMTDRGGYISYKARGHQEPKPYEMNITFFDAINRPHDESYEANQRFMASQAFMLALKGVPGVYIHSLLASRNNGELARETGIKRLINRAQIQWELLTLSLEEHVSRRAQVLKHFKAHIQTRKTLLALHPHATQKVLRKNSKIFVVQRTYQNQTVTLVINVSDEVIDLPEYQGFTNAFDQKIFEGKVGPYHILYLLKP